MSIELPTKPAPVRHVQAGGESVVHSTAFEWFARSGFVARGLIYGIIGILALELALGSGGKATNQQGALKTIAQQPFGKVLLIVVAIGLFGYALWRGVRAAVGHGREQADDTKKRLDSAFSAFGYAALFVTAVKIIIGSGSGGGGDPSKTTGGVLDWPGGQLLVAIAGIVIVGVGVEQGYKGMKKKFLEESKTEEMSDRVRKAFTALGVFGFLARMVVFALIGYFLFKAAIDYDPDKAVSLDGALSALGQASYGPILLGIVAVGLIGFGLYSFADARYRKV
jgi:uncharacterized protein DUF1206